MRNFTSFLFMCLLTFAGFAQGHETFDNLGIDANDNSYQDGSFTGQDGSTWSYIQSRGDTDAEITEDNPAIMLGKNKESEVTSGSLSNGMGTLKFTYMQVYSANTNVNEQLVYTATTEDQSGEAITTDEIAVNIDGDFTLRFYNPSGAGQVSIDDVIWTATGSNPNLTIVSPTDYQEYEPGDTPVITFNVTNFDLSTSAGAADGDGYIKYELDDNGATDYFSTDPIVLDNLEQGEHYITMRLVDNDGMDLNPEVMDDVYFGTNEFVTINSIGDLRNGEQGGYYTLTHEVVLSYQQDFRGQKYIQDDSGAILIDDPDGEITTTYNRYDGITGISGVLGENNGVLELQPMENTADASSTDNFVTPVVLTIEDFMADPSAYESQIIAFKNVEFEEADGTVTFDVGTNYTVTDGSNQTTMRTDFYDADYINQVIPQGTQTALVGIASQFNGDGQFFIRDHDDLEGNTLSVEVITTADISLYPNPASQNIYLQLQGEAQVQIFSILGKRVFHTKMNDEISIPVENLNTGMYFVKISQQGQTVTKKLIVE